MTQVKSLQRFPVKGLSAETLTSVRLAVKSFFPGDRIFALANGPTDFNPEAPSFQSKTRFLMLMKNAKLAELVTRYDEETQTLVISHGGQERLRADLSGPAGYLAVEKFFEDFCSTERRGPIRLLRAPDGFRFTDSIRTGFVSILNLASVHDLERRMGAPVDPLRFRANIQVEGWPAWLEEDLVGKRLQVGDVQLKVLKTIDRCAATHVDPGTGLRDLNIMGALEASFGRLSCGIYASVERGGPLSVGDPASVLD